jgi:hypothetical protein
MSFFKLTMLGYDDKLKEIKKEDPHAIQSDAVNRRELTLNQMVFYSNQILFKKKK